MLDTGLADRLRARGVNVVEIAGWKTRGVADFAPRGSVNHHTAGSASGVAPSLNVCIYGRTGLAGPLCHVLLGRDLVAYVIAAGRANHAGVGSWKGLSGNRVMHGLEIEHVGVGEAPAQLMVALQIHAAFLEAPGSSRNAIYTCQHFEWAPTRKVDFRNLAPWTPNSFRNDIASLLQPAPSPSPIQKDEDMPYLTSSKFTGVTYHDGAGSTWLSSGATVSSLRAQGVPVFNLDANETDARRIVTDRFANTDERILEAVNAVGKASHTDLVAVQKAITETLSAL